MREQPIRAKFLRESDGSGFTAFLEYPNGIHVEITSPTWRKLTNLLKSWNVNTDSLYDFQVPDGMGFLERALR